MKLNLLEHAFQKAICTESVPAKQSHVCGCGQTYMNTDEPLYYGTFQGAIVVAGCNCQFSSAFGGMLWAHRHAIADFLRLMGESLEADLVQLRGELPAELGEQTREVAQ